MKIGINALFWRPDGMGGTQTYFLNLVNALLKICPEHELCVFLKADGAANFRLPRQGLKSYAVLFLVNCHPFV